MLCLDKYGWPVELIKGQWVRNIIRCLLLTCSIYRGTIAGWRASREAEYDKRLERALETARHHGITFDVESAAKFRHSLSYVGGSPKSVRDSGCCCICDSRIAALKSTDSYVTTPADRKVDGKGR